MDQEFPADGLVFAGQDAGLHLDHRDPRAETEEGLGQFEPDHGTSEDHEVLGPLTGGERFGGGPVGRLRKPRYGRNRRTGTGRNEDPIRLEGLGLAPFGRLDGEDLWGHEGRHPTHEEDVGVRVENVLILGLAEFIDARLLLGEELRRVEEGSRPADAPERMMFNLMGDLGGTDQDLRGHTAHIHTGAAEHAPFDQGHLGAGAGGSDGAGHCRRATAQDGDPRRGSCAGSGAGDVSEGRFGTVTLRTDRLDQPVRGDLVVLHHPGTRVREGDVGLDTGKGIECRFDRACTVFAGHSGDGEVRRLAHG